MTVANYNYLIFLQFMNKAAVNTFIKNLDKARLVTKASPWAMEADGQQEWHIRFAGVKLPNEWQEVIGPENNVLCKFLVNRSAAFLEFYLANKPPFILMMRQPLIETDRWEPILGGLKRTLSSDKKSFQQHQDAIDNLYKKIKPYLK